MNQAFGVLITLLASISANGNLNVPRSVVYELRLWILSHQPTPCLFACSSKIVWRDTMVRILSDLLVSVIALLHNYTYTGAAPGDLDPFCSRAMSMAHHDASIVLNLVLIINVAHVHRLSLSVVG